MNFVFLLSLILILNLEFSLSQKGLADEGNNFKE